MGAATKKQSFQFPGASTQIKPKSSQNHINPHPSHPFPGFPSRSQASFARLALVSEEKLRRGAGPEAPGDAALEAEILGMALELALDEKTGKGPEEWEAWAIMGI